MPYNTCGDKIRPRIKIKNPIKTDKKRKFPSKCKLTLSLTFRKIKIIIAKKTPIKVTIKAKKKSHFSTIFI
jgi:hypothetical protein